MRDVQVRRDVARAVVQPLMQGVRDRKVKGTYHRFRPGPDGRSHTVLSPDTASGRLSSSDSPFFPDSSTNHQNAEKKIAMLDPLYRVRDVVVAAPGKVLLAGDLSNAEAMGVALYSRDIQWYEQMMNGFDTHSFHAKHFWNLEGSLDDIKKNFKLNRDIAKILTYLSLYYGKARTAMMNLNKEGEKLGKYFTEAETFDLQTKLLQLHPLEAWWAAVREALRDGNGSLRNCFGYRRTFYQPEEDSRLKDALSFLPQSTVAWLMNHAVPIVYAKFDVPGVRELLLQIHDELLFECYIDEVPYLIRNVTPVVQRPFTIHGYKAYIPLEWKIGSCWGKMKELKDMSNAELSQFSLTAKDLHA